MSKSRVQPTKSAPYYQQNLKKAWGALEKCEATPEAYIEVWDEFITATLRQFGEQLGILNKIELWEFTHDFQQAKKFAGRLRAKQDRINFFEAVKTDFEQFLVMLEHDMVEKYELKLADNGFGKLCDLEIAKYRTLLDPRDRDDSNNGRDSEETESAKLLADVCGIFAIASLETRRTAWEMMQKFTRRQWACFTDTNKILKKSTKTDRAKRMEEISGFTGLRTLFNKPKVITDQEVVGSVMTLLIADQIKNRKKTS